ncbi:hypothetical protein ACWEQU_17415 [Streptomyces nodosus]
MAVATGQGDAPAGAVQPMPADVAIDGVAEFLDTCNSTPAAWPHEAATIHYHAIEGRSWLLALDGTGARPAPLTDDAAPASASATGTAEQLLLFVWGRLTLGARGVASQYRQRTASMTSASVNIASSSASARRTANTASYSSGPSASRSTADSVTSRSPMGRYA